MLLAVETSGLSGSIALFSEGKVYREQSLGADGPRHAQALVRETDVLLRNAGLTVSDLTSVAVSIGPGSFTGLRVGVVFAKTLAWLRGIPLVAVNSLQALAWQVPPSVQRITMISDAQRSEVFSLDCQWDTLKEEWLPVGDVCVRDLVSLQPVRAVAGPVVDRHRPSLAAQRPSQMLFSLVPQATGVGQVGMRLLAAGVLSCAETLEPLYVRPSYAEEKRSGNR